jgi:hypothetical protein
MSTEAEGFVLVYGKCTVHKTLSLEGANTVDACCLSVYTIAAYVKQNLT